MTTDTSGGLLRVEMFACAMGLASCKLAQFDQSCSLLSTLHTLGINGGFAITFSTAEASEVGLGSAKDFAAILEVVWLTLPPTDVATKGTPSRMHSETQ